ncbi:MAG: hypothetical protein U5K69_03635 [Balneolaceae bacterium]|nr:hypothetical protein [Balneolaceae bacterium]
MNHSQLHSKSGGDSLTRRFSHVAARLISDIANPLLVPPLVFFSLGYILSLPATELGWIATVSLVFYCLVPFGITLWLLNTGHIQSLDIPLRKNREKLFRLSIISSTIGSLFMFYLCINQDRILLETALVFLLNPFLGYAINRRFKISIHTASLATAAALLLALYLRMPDLYVSAGLLSMAILFVIIPAMIWARLNLKIHSFLELFGGVLAGMTFALLELGILQLIW